MLFGQVDEWDFYRNNHHAAVLKTTLNKIRVQVAHAFDLGCVYGGLYNLHDARTIAIPLKERRAMAVGLFQP